MEIDSIRRLVEQVLREKLGAQGFSHAIVSETEDEEGRPALTIRSIFGAGRTVLTGLDSIRAKHEVRRALIANGEDRFPYVRHELPEESAA